MKQAMIYIGLFTAILFGTTTAQAEDYMSADQIKSLIAGKTVYAEHLKRGFEFKVYFDSDGTTAIRQQKGETTTTTYSFKGDKHCIQWRGKNRCANISDNGDGSYSRINKRGKAVVKWIKVEDGKQL